MTTTATKTKTCKSTSFFGEKCKLSHGHSKRHTWDTNDYRRKKWEAEGKKGKKIAPGGKKKHKGRKTTPGGPDVGTVKGVMDKKKEMADKATAVSEVIDVMISFDTTGSMSPCIAQVRRNTVSLVERLFKDIPDLRIGIIAHGDYDDEGETYVTKRLDLTRDVKKITNFVKTCGNTCGYDTPECYELVLHEARTEASWEEGRNKVLVMIGDATPHPPSYPKNKKNLDWKVECEKLGKAGIAVYTVQCLRHSTASDFFWKGAAEISGGHYLVLDKFENVRDLIRAVCYKQQSVESLENFVRAVEHSGRMSGGMARVYSTLLGYEISADGAEADGAVHIDPGRFIVFKVTKDMDIRDFVEARRKKFRKGCAYYQFTKSVKVQDHKEIILLEEATGDMFGGRQARRILGLPEYGTISVSPSSCAALQDGRYTAFVQSTSVNRKLIKGTKLLYENEGWGS